MGNLKGVTRFTAAFKTQFRLYFGLKNLYLYEFVNKRVKAMLQLKTAQFYL